MRLNTEEWPELVDHYTPKEANRGHKRRRIKQSKVRNLLELLINFEDYVLHFMEEKVPITLVSIILT
ncbi:MAG: hypothetical protein KAH18_13350 [Psychromonas sp.]|nr:hypothetical protein [Psychromonas sp.]